MIKIFGVFTEIFSIIQQPKLYSLKLRTIRPAVSYAEKRQGAEPGLYARLMS